VEAAYAPAEVYVYHLKEAYPMLQACTCPGAWQGLVG